MTQVLVHPFKIVGSIAATVDSDSDDAVVQQVAVLLTTGQGERPLLPAYGVTDPVFAAYDQAEINAGLAMFLPDTHISSIDVTPLSDTSEQIDVQVAGAGEL